MNPDCLTRSEKDALRRGEPVQVGNHRYLLCPQCGKIVCMTKRLFGALHVCTGRKIPGA